MATRHDRDKRIAQTLARDVESLGEFERIALVEKFERCELSRDTPFIGP